MSRQGVMIVVATLALASVFALIFEIFTRIVRRRAFIDSYAWPPGLIGKFRARRPEISRGDCARVEEGLRQFFRAYLAGGRRYVAMPSQVVDDLWHEFILYTRAYKEFCDQAFGCFLHHTPALALKPAQRESNAGLRRVWSACCKEQNINPRKPDRLPLLFALDAELRIADGFHYSTDCRVLRDNGVASPYCGGDFSDSGVDGTVSGLAGDGGGGHGHGGHGGHGDGGHGGGDGGHGGHGCGGDGGGGCGGGCGGGGD